jgi:hypothetical protein
MNDLEILHDAWEAPDPPSHTAFTAARADLLARAARRGRARARRRRRVRLALAGVSAVAAAAGTTLVVSVGEDGRPASIAPGVSIASADVVLERAAAAAEQQPFTPPRNDQWIYTEDRFSGSDGSEPKTWQTWRRADGGGYAWKENGKLHVEMLERTREVEGRPVPLIEGYKEFAALPTDPDALLRWAYEQAKHITGGGVTDHGDVYLQFNHMLRSNLLPPDLQAAIYRALKQVPNVTVETIDVFGRPALALVQTEDWLREELLLDPDTYAYLGERSTVVRDTRISPEKAGNATGEVRRGDHVISERVTTAIVDEPGARP